MLDVTTTAWVATIAVLLALLVVDLGLGILRPHEVRFREAALMSIAYVVISLAFGATLGAVAGWDFGGQFLAGYIVEKSLSVDNLFVFVVIMGSFSVPRAQQHKVLTLGIAMALVLRVILITIGAALLDAFSFMFVVFGLVLFVTGVQLFRHRNQDPSLDDNALVRLARRRLPISSAYDGGKIVTRVGQRRVLTPLFIVLVAVGSTDLLFALDSIPAVFGVTNETYIVITANAFALLGLRPLFFLVTGLLDRVVYLSTGLALILAFIGIKLVLHWGHLQVDGLPQISTVASLVVIGLVLAATTVASLVRARHDPSARAHAGSLRNRPPRD